MATGIKKIEGLLSGTSNTTQRSLFEVFDPEYNSVNFDVASQDTSPEGMAFNSDGTKMFIVGSSTDAVYQYSLSSGFDLSTASYDSISFSLISQTGTPTGIAFNTDGTKMYIVSRSNRTVYQYSLTTGFDLSTASYSFISFTLNQTVTLYDLAFSSDGTKMFLSSISPDLIYECSLTTSFDLSTASYDSVSFSVTNEGKPTGIAFNTDGTKMYIVTIDNDSVYQYSLSSGFDLSTASYDSASYSVASQDTSPEGMAFNSDGTKMCIVGNNTRKIFEYDPKSINTKEQLLYTVPSGFAAKITGSFYTTGTRADLLINNNVKVGSKRMEFDGSVHKVSNGYSFHTQTYYPRIESTDFFLLTSGETLALRAELLGTTSYEFRIIEDNE